MPVRELFQKTGKIPFEAAGADQRQRLDLKVAGKKMTDTRRRVKLYALNAERQWDDKGTGHVSHSYIERFKGISLLVRAEADGESTLKLPPIYYRVDYWLLSVTKDFYAIDQRLLFWGF